MNLQSLLEKRFPPLEQRLEPRDCMLYALGIGLGADPCDELQLPFVYEQSLQVFPTQAFTVASPGFWFAAPELGIDCAKILHGEQTVEIGQPLQVGHNYLGRYRVLGVVDKGAGKGAIVHVEKTLEDKESGEFACAVTSSFFLRGDGGCGSTSYEPSPLPATPERRPDRSIAIATPANAALLYRLSGDYNPIHASPAAARRAGFERPILHGLCTMGLAARAVIDACAEGKVERLAFIGQRFSAPLYPGEALRVDQWLEPDGIAYSATAAGREVRVLSHGWARLTAPG